MKPHPAVSPVLLIPFSYESKEIRVIQDQFGNPWWVAKDVCDILGLGNVTNALVRIPDNHKGVNRIKTPGGTQKLNVVDEPGLYRLILRSDKPQAESFMEWVTADVLPSIRKTGKYQETIHDRRRLRHEAASSYKVMNAVLQLIRQNHGKETKFFHYANEAKLVNWAITGEFKPLDRDSLNHKELDLLAKLEERNAVLVGCGLGREDRKMALTQFVTDFKTPMLTEGDAA